MLHAWDLDVNIASSLQRSIILRHGGALELQPFYSGLTAGSTCYGPIIQR